MGSYPLVTLLSRGGAGTTYALQEVVLRRDCQGVLFPRAYTLGEHTHYNIMDIDSGIMGPSPRQLSGQFVVDLLEGLESRPGATLIVDVPLSQMESFTRKRSERIADLVAAHLRHGPAVLPMLPHRGSFFQSIRDLIDDPLSLPRDRRELRVVPNGFRLLADYVQQAIPAFDDPLAKPVSAF